jgi:hypothetical protein
MNTQKNSFIAGARMIEVKNQPGKRSRTGTLVIL